MAGAAILKLLTKRGYRNTFGHPTSTPDWRDRALTREFLNTAKPDIMIVAAGLSGGIDANRRAPADLMLDNLLVVTSILPAAKECGVRKLLYIASSCCYPKECSQPMRVESLYSGKLEPTSMSYATAKLAGIELCRAFRAQHNSPFICAIPADVYGPSATYDERDSHVIPALIKKMQKAKTANEKHIILWGSGNPKREFLFVDDLADACIFLITQYEGPDPINIGPGTELTIREAAQMIKEVVGFDGALTFDTSRPDGAERKLLDSTALSSLGWHPATGFRSGIEQTYQGYLEPWS